MLGSFSVLKDPAPLARLEAVYVIVCSSMLIIANICSHVKSYFKKSTNISDSCLRSPQGTVEWAWDHFAMLAKKMPQAHLMYLYFRESLRMNRYALTALGAPLYIRILGGGLFNSVEELFWKKITF